MACLKQIKKLKRFVLLKSYPKYKIDRDRNKAHTTDKNINTYNPLKKTHV